MRAAEEQFAATVTPLDLAGDRAAAVGRINEGAKTQTRGLVSEIVTVASLPVDAHLVVTTAVYFKSWWQIRFEPAKPRPFHVPGGAPQMLPTMWQMGRFALGQTQDFDVLRMRFRSPEFSMLTILPRRSLPLSALASLVAKELPHLPIRAGRGDAAEVSLRNAGRAYRRAARDGAHGGLHARSKFQRNDVTSKRRYFQRSRDDDGGRG